MFLVAALLLGATTSHALGLSACEPVPEKAVAVLQSDLSCVGQDLQVGSGATLDLNGFTLTGSVMCASGTCALTSSGAGGAIVGRVGPLRRIDNVSIDCCDSTCVDQPAFLTRSTSRERQACVRSGRTERRATQADSTVRRGARREYGPRWRAIDARSRDLVRNAG